MSEMIHYIVR